MEGVAEAVGGAEGMTADMKVQSSAAADQVGESDRDGAVVGVEGKPGDAGVESTVAAADVEVEVPVGGMRKIEIERE